MNKLLFQFASPEASLKLVDAWIPWFRTAAILFFVVGFMIGFVYAPRDFQQGNAYRIIYLHVPAAWMSMLIYLAMAFWAVTGWTLNTRVSYMMMSALAPTGAMFTFLALWTGALWGKPTWGAWWVWDARLTSELILLFIYFGFIALQSAIEDRSRADKAGALLIMIGVVNIPIIYFSVQWWNTLHQGATLSLNNSPQMAKPMLSGLLVMTGAFWCYSITAGFQRLRCIILEREQNTEWIKTYWGNR